MGANASRSTRGQTAAQTDLRHGDGASISAFRAGDFALRSVASRASSCRRRAPPTARPRVAEPRLPARSRRRRGSTPAAAASHRAPSSRRSSARRSPTGSRSASVPTPTCSSRRACCLSCVARCDAPRTARETPGGTEAPKNAIGRCVRRGCAGSTEGGSRPPDKCRPRVPPRGLPRWPTRRATARAAHHRMRRSSHGS